MIYAQLNDSQTKIITVFSSPQNETEYPNQAVLEDDDARYLAFINPPIPDSDGFMQSIKTGLGGIVAVSVIPGSWALNEAINQGNWSDVQDLLINAKNTSAITNDQYNSIKASATTFNIPVTL